MMELQEIGRESLEQIKALYLLEGWSAYLGDDSKLARALDNSLYTLGVFDKGDLVAFVRCLGDGEHAVLVQDLLVKDGYKRQGLGTRLMRHVFKKYAYVRWLQVNTDLNDERANLFYLSLGMRKVEEGSVVSYFR